MVFFCGFESLVNKLSPEKTLHFNSVDSIHWICWCALRELWMKRLHWYLFLSTSKWLNCRRGLFCFGLEIVGALCSLTFWSSSLFLALALSYGLVLDLSFNGKGLYCSWINGCPSFVVLFYGNYFLDKISWIRVLGPRVSAVLKGVTFFLPAMPFFHVLFGHWVFFLSLSLSRERRKVFIHYQSLSSLRPPSKFKHIIHWRKRK